MIIGTFWCQREKLWVRFNEENGAVTAEIARISDNPKMTTPWEAVSEGAWFVNYTEKNNEKIYLYYAIKNNKLYYSEGSIDKYSNALMVSEKRNGNYFPTKKYSFPKELTEETELTPYHELPLTPEMLAEKNRLDEEAQKLKQAQEAEKWKKIRVTDLHRRGMHYIYSQSPFSEDIDHQFLDLLKTELAELDPRKSDSPYDYLCVLKDIIENSNNEWHQKIIASAARTEHNNQLGIEGSRDELFRLKKSLFFNVIRSEANSLADEFKIDFKILNENEIVKKPVAKNLVVDEYASDLDYQGFNDEPDEIFDIELENNRLLQQAIQESLEPIIYPRSNAEATNYNQEFLAKPRDIEVLISAVILAQQNYENWYKAGTWYKDGNNLRGANGFFSWLRHGDDGQKRASELVDGILESRDDSNVASSLINDFLKSDSTKYHRHSFASFLLDNLKNIANTPWFGINCIEGSNLYDQNAVIEQLGLSAEINAQR